MQPVVSKPSRLREYLQLLGPLWAIFCIRVVYLRSVCTHGFNGNRCATGQSCRNKLCSAAAPSQLLRYCLWLSRAKGHDVHALRASSAARPRLCGLSIEDALALVHEKVRAA